MTPPPKKNTPQNTPPQKVPPPKKLRKIGLHLICKKKASLWVQKSWGVEGEWGKGGGSDNCCGFGSHSINVVITLPSSYPAFGPMRHPSSQPRTGSGCHTGLVDGQIQHADPTYGSRATPRPWPQCTAL